MFQQADVVVNASVSEAFPYAVVEAMLTGAAVVATDVGGVREAIGETGLLVHPRDPIGDGRSDRARCSRREDQREQLGRQARERALRWFTEERFVQEYRASYAQLVNPVTVRRRLARGPLTMFDDAASESEPESATA